MIADGKVQKGANSIRWLGSKRGEMKFWHGILVALLAVAMVPVTEVLGSENHTIRPPAHARKFAPGPSIGSISFDCKASVSGRCNLRDFVDYARVCALVVIENGRKRLEFYNDDPNVCRDEGGQPNGPHRLYGIASVAKSITSTLVGHAIATRYGAQTREDFKAILDRPLRNYVSGLGKGPSSAYSGVSLDRVLRMRSGVRWREYGWHGFFSDANRFGLDVRDHQTQSIPEFARRYRQQSAEGPTFNYSALDSAIAGYAAETMLGHRLVDFMEKGLWSQIGAEAKARWGIDKAGIAIGPCCLKATVGDLARFGRLVLDKGRLPGGKQLVPKAWFELATQKSAEDDSIPVENVSQNRDCPLEYRYFWWLRKGHSDYTAVGRDGQFVHVYPREHVVIVQISDWKAWTNGDFLECETFEAHDALATIASRKRIGAERTTKLQLLND